MTDEMRAALKGALRVRRKYERRRHRRFQRSLRQMQRILGARIAAGATIGSRSAAEWRKMFAAKIRPFVEFP